MKMNVIAYTETHMVEYYYSGILLPYGKFSRQMSNVLYLQFSIQFIFAVSTKTIM